MGRGAEGEREGGREGEGERERESERERIPSRLHTVGSRMQGSIP